MKNDFPVFESQASAASIIGCSLAQIRRAKKNGCKAFISGGRIDSGVLIPFLFSEMSSGNDGDEAPPDGLATWRDALNRAQTKREEIRLAKDKGQVVEFDEARRQASEAASLYFAELDRMCRELPPILKGLDEIGVFKKLEQRREEIRETLNRAFDAVGKAE